MYDHICYPTDGSEGAEAAAEHVEALASSFDATVDVVYVVEDRPVDFGLMATGITDVSPGMSGDHHGADAVAMGGSQADPEAEREQLVKESEVAVAERAEALDADAEPVVLTGTPHAAITEYADQEDADLIVMGTHGRTGLDRILIGSVTEKIVRTADTPVVTVRPDGDVSER
ncbi:universal stress protein [Halorubrum vacuolatum]|uniref:Nucleotide-binding universal stress protein, UspA family n=1 Tax=Halorubrum vacuolatum TaxID=63740 RepID=A0A238V8F2_HALVU|nr:universal stress protein [Halorubrum vacuolatum]SNR30722.1 Nucleotide-binding universal stress protein, UspA family [Halorubrum vacuolatum]